MDEINRMKNNLLLIRRAVGWTAEEFGERIGVTRQTINNIEGGRNKLSKTQYIAMRSVLSAEINEHPEETKMLQVLLDMLVDHSENYSSKEVEELLSKANLISPSILAGTASRTETSIEWEKAVKAIGGTALMFLSNPITARVITNWVFRLYKKKK